MCQSTIEFKILPVLQYISINSDLFVDMKINGSLQINLGVKKCTLKFHKDDGWLNRMIKHLISP